MTDAQLVRIAWWNSSLSPDGKPRGIKSLWERASAVVKTLVLDYNVDLLAVGEIAHGQLFRLVEENSLDGYSVHENLVKEGRLQFETGLIYKKSIFNIRSFAPIISGREFERHKVAERIDLDLHASPVHLFVSHWPSRLSCPEGCSDRNDLGKDLREGIRGVIGDGKSPRNPMILLGDYNDDPYNKSLSKYVRATRDRRLVQRDPRFLYNPFWRHLSEPNYHIRGEIPDGFPGTAYYSGGAEFKWNTFDQIIFSSEFVTTGEWQLNEEKTSILQLPDLCKDISKSNGIFDHFPVIGTIERRA